ncbi:hypothetical protein EHP00_753 [Ecytonucleospora hepatopenaei]|uniref:Mechanosensitive ion channel MscS domain-containing protein n=1 Tax=Ecytonucleospora hepatopenaei TaxID=646526 RepID=A0A1W0E3C3_9MICR|nr:hypothetical protein EHP00_753 [Ecytonucleospora hepatopenaei]
MFLDFLRFITKTNNADLTKVLKDKMYKSAFVYITKPFAVGSKITIEGNSSSYSGTVEDVNLFYVKLREYRKETFVPTSFIYDKVIYKHI